MSSVSISCGPCAWTRQTEEPRITAHVDPARLDPTRLLSLADPTLLSPSDWLLLLPTASIYVSIGFYRGSWLRLLLLCAPLLLSSIAALLPPPPPLQNPLGLHQLCCLPASLLLLPPPCLLHCCCS